MSFLWVSSLLHRIHQKKLKFKYISFALSLIFVMIYCQFSIRVETTSFAKTTNIKQGFMRKVKEYLKDIGLQTTFSNFFLQKKKIIKFVGSFFYFFIKIVSKLTSNVPLRNILREKINSTNVCK